jgi:RNase adaptor protein for sRNA GlmZ degradation
MPLTALRQSRLVASLADALRPSLSAQGISVLALRPGCGPGGRSRGVGIEEQLEKMLDGG